VYKIRKGDRIAQIVLQRVPRIQFKVVDSVKEIGNNRGGDLVPPEYGSNKKSLQKAQRSGENLELFAVYEFLILPKAHER